jgi:hypothetical protein
MKWFFGILIVSFSILLIWINVRLYAENFNLKEEQEDIVSQLNFLEKELKTNNAGEEMQQIFPEGLVFTNVLYGLSWCELATSNVNLEPHLKQRAIQEALFAYKQINSEIAQSTFEVNLDPPHGIFYVGWKNYLLSKIISLDTSFVNNKFYRETFEEQCEQIKESLISTDYSYLESYHNQAWPGDMCVAMASLSMHDRTLKPKFQAEIKNWLAHVRTKLDPKTGLIPHKIGVGNEKISEGARGSSSSLINRLLPEVDSTFAKQQYDLYKNHFVETTFGLPSVREYPKGNSGTGDIDSGPVIFEVGFSGTIVAFSTMAVNNDLTLAKLLYKTINAIGFGNNVGDMKKYAFGKIPVADAFIAWGRASKLKFYKNENNNLKLWAGKFHGLSALLLFLLFGIFKIVFLNKKA